MKLGLLSTLVSVLSIASLATVAACATASKTQIAGGPGDPNAPDASAAPSDDDDDVTKQPPHSLGTIVLGETHSAGSSKATPIVSAKFYPDALLTKSCKTKLDEGCEIVQTPKCTKVASSSTGCNSNEICSYDDSCDAVCTKYSVAVCETPCDVDEVCKGATPTSTTGTCVKSEAFDAGPLAFSGTTTSITMFPPYQFDQELGQGAPFLAGAEIQVQAQGAITTGFEKFDEKFKATTFLQTTPSLSKIAKDKIFGTGPIPISWLPGSDTILVTVAGVAGSATCKVQDSLGTFSLPRSVVKATQGTGVTASSTFSLSVARQRKEVRKDKKAKGTLSITEVQPVGWLELVTVSTESASFQGCTGTETFCGETCTDLSYDTENCGTCGNACLSGQSCSSGSCTGTSSSCYSCRSSAESGSCYSQSSNCQANVSCSDLEYCFQNCSTTTCQNSCISSYPSGASLFSSLRSCWSTYCSSSCTGLN